MAIVKDLIHETSRMLDSEKSLLNKKFFEKNFKKILIVIILLMGHIQLRYEYEKHIVNIGKLKLERNDKRYTSIEKWSILTGKNRPEAIRGKVAQSSVELIESDERPVVMK